MMRKLLLAAFLCLIPIAASAQCNGVFPNGTFCGNNSGSPAIPYPVTPSYPVGPSTTTVGDLATWGNTTGTTLNDSPVGYGVLAAIANSVNASGGLLTYGLIGTSGATIPLNNTNNILSGNLTLSGNNNYSGMSNFTGSFKVGGNIMTFPVSAADLAYQVGALTNGHCLMASGTAGGIADSGVACGGTIFTLTPMASIAGAL